MNRGQFPRIWLTDGAATFARFQNWWIDRPVTWSGQQWSYLDFSWEGLISGQGSVDQVTITAPALPSVVDLVRRALAGTWLCYLEIWAAEDNGSDIDAGPPASAVLVGSAVGEVVGASGGLTSITIRLGSALSPIGAQFPPRSASTELIGVPCQL